MHLFATTTDEQVLELGKKAPITEIEKPRGGQTGSTDRRRGQ
jgi:hypothetical protein